MQKELKDYTDIELIMEIRKCDKEILNMLTMQIGTYFVEHYPGQIMGLGDYYCEKAILIDELLRRKNEKEDKFCYHFT